MMLEIVTYLVTFHWFVVSIYTILGIIGYLLYRETAKSKEYYKALHFAMNPDKVAEHFIKIGMAKQLELDDKESKNIVVKGAGNIQTGSQVKTWKVVEE